MARKKSEIVKPNPQQVTAETGLTPKQAEKFRNLARKPDSEGKWLSLSRARELALKKESIMNNNQYESIGESIWSTYKSLGILIEEKLTKDQIASRKAADKKATQSTNTGTYKERVKARRKARIEAITPGGVAKHLGTS